MSLNPQETYVLLGIDGAARALPGGAQFWALPECDLTHCGEGWLVSEHLFKQNCRSWEMHPHADGFVYLLSGDGVLHLEQADGIRTVTLRGSVAVIVPRGVWHTARRLRRAVCCNITRGEGAQIRSA